MASCEDAKSDLSIDVVGGKKDAITLLESSTENEQVDAHDSKERKNKLDDKTSESDESDFDFEFECEICDKTFSGFKPLQQHEKSVKHHKALLKKTLKEELSREVEEEDETTVEDCLTSKLFTVCGACKKQFSGPESFQLHLKSRAHRKKMAKAKLMEQAMEDGHVNIEKLKSILKKGLSKSNTVGFSEALEDSEDECSNESAPQFECPECDKVFSGVESWYQHSVSKIHEKTMAKKKLMEKLTSSSAFNDTQRTELTTETLKVVDDVLTCQLCHMSFSGPENASEHLRSRGHKKKLEDRAWKLSHLRSRNSEATLSSIAKEGKPSIDSSSDLESSTEQRNTDPQSTDNVASDDLDDSSPTVKSQEEESPEDEVKNTLLRYEKYKEYKQIMAQVNPEEQ